MPSRSPACVCDNHHERIEAMYQELEKFLLYGAAMYVLVQCILATAHVINFAAANAHQDFSSIFSGIGFIGLGILPL